MNAGEDWKKEPTPKNWKDARTDLNVKEVLNTNERKWLEIHEDKLVAILTDEQLFEHPLFNLKSSQHKNKVWNLPDSVSRERFEDEIPEEQLETSEYI
jgi:hypothetical protein